MISTRGYGAVVVGGPNAVGRFAGGFGAFTDDAASGAVSAVEDLVADKAALTDSEGRPKAPLVPSSDEIANAATNGAMPAVMAQCATSASAGSDAAAAVEERLRPVLMGLAFLGEGGAASALAKVRTNLESACTADTLEEALTSPDERDRQAAALGLIIAFAVFAGAINKALNDAVSRWGFGQSRATAIRADLDTIATAVGAQVNLLISTPGSASAIAGSLRSLFDRMKGYLYEIRRHVNAVQIARAREAAMAPVRDRYRAAFTAADTAVKYITSSAPGVALHLTSLLTRIADANRTTTDPAYVDVLARRLAEAATFATMANDVARWPSSAGFDLAPFLVRVTDLAQRFAATSVRNPVTAHLAELEVIINEMTQAVPGPSGTAPTLTQTVRPAGYDDALAVARAGVARIAALDPVNFYEAFWGGNVRYFEARAAQATLADKVALDAFRAMATAYAVLVEKRVQYTAASADAADLDALVGEYNVRVQTPYTATGPRNYPAIQAAAESIGGRAMLLEPNTLPPTPQESRAVLAALLNTIEALIARLRADGADAGAAIAFESELNGLRARLDSPPTTDVSGALLPAADLKRRVEAAFAKAGVPPWVIGVGVAAVGVLAAVVIAMSRRRGGGTRGLGRHRHRAA